MAGAPCALEARMADLFDVGAVPDPLTWRVDEFDTTEYAAQCLKATEVAGSSAPFLGHNLYHIHRDELGGTVPNGCISDSDGFLYLQEDAMPLVIGGRELENLPLTAVEFQARVTAVLLLGGFTDELVKEAAQLARNNDPCGTRGSAIGEQLDVDTLLWTID